MYSKSNLVRLSLVAAILTVASSASIVPANAATPSISKQGIYVVLTGDKSFAEAVVEAAQLSPEYRSRVASLVPNWIQTLRSGHALGATSINAQSTAEQDLAEVSSIQSWLKDPAAMPKRANSTPTTSPANRSASPATPAIQNGGPHALEIGDGAAPSVISPAYVNPGDPNSFQVRGQPGSGRTYWTGANTAVAFAYCTGTCYETDRITARGTVNPGAVSDRIDITTVYSPNHGHLNPYVDLQFKSINRGIVTGTGTAAQMPSSRSWVQGNGRSYRGTVLTISIALGVDIYPAPYNGAERWDGAKTADATCSTSDNTCRY